MQTAPEETDDQLPAGTVIANRFRIKEMLGKGGMARVYEAEHMVTGRSLALKVASQTFVNDELLSSRFMREAKTATTIRHPHAIEVTDVFRTEDRRPIMVMELLKGQDLGACLKERERLPAREVASIFLPVLGAIAHAHAQGIIHRDLKPDNIFLSRVDGDTRPKVLDFGIAKVVGDAVDRATLKLTSTGMLLGTPFYMSPEQVSGHEDLDHRADIWALGVVLYECLTGELPFAGTNFGQVFSGILQKKPDEKLLRSVDVPDEMIALVLRCLAKSPDDRPASCGEIAEVLAPFGGKTPSHFPAPIPVRADEEEDEALASTIAAEPDAGPLPERSQKGRALAFFVVTGLLLLGGLAFVLFGGSETPEPETPDLLTEPVEEPEPPTETPEPEAPTTQTPAMEALAADQDPTVEEPVEPPRMTRRARMRPTVSSPTMDEAGGIIGEL